jgi:hypothetical protein
MDYCWCIYVKLLTGEKLYFMNELFRWEIEVTIYDVTHIASYVLLQVVLLSDRKFVRIRLEKNCLEILGYCGPVIF